MTVAFYVNSGDANLLHAYLLNGNDVISGSSDPELLFGYTGNDSILGGGGDDFLDDGGADVFNAGAGNDRIIVSDATFFDVDGGSGSDTLAIGGLSLNLSSVANTRITGIEIVDLSGGGNNTLTLTTADLLDLSDSSNTLRVDGAAGDGVTSTGQGWVSGGTVDIGGVMYQRYTDGTATLLLDPDIVATSSLT